MSIRRDAAGRQPRVTFVDATRGLLFVLMTSSHALTLANVSEASWLQSVWWLPRGWATHGFILLTGFSTAFIFSGMDPSRRNRRLRLRAGQILAVMFVSNVVMLLMKLALSSQIATVFDFHWWLGLLTLDTEYSISGILLPTALFLLIAPWLFALFDRAGSVMTFAISLTLASACWLVTIRDGAFLVSHRAMNVLFISGAGGFPVLPFVSYGIVGFVFGIVWKNRQWAFDRWHAVIAGALLALLQSLDGVLPVKPVANALVTVLTATAHFIVILLFGGVASEVLDSPGPLRLLPLIGRYALFSFVMHRIVMQFLALVDRGFVPTLPPGIAYAWYVVATLMVIAACCLARERYSACDRALKRIYL